jgi:hypothetical protein
MPARASGFYDSQVIELWPPRGGYNPSDFAKFAMTPAQNAERREVMPA